MTYRKMYLEKNKEKCLEKCRQYFEENKESLQKMAH